MHNTIGTTMTLLLGATAGHADRGFDQRCERDNNIIYRPADRYAPDNLLNSANVHVPDDPGAGARGPQT